MLLDRAACLKLGFDRDCPNAECPSYIPPVPNDVLRRKALCARAVTDVGEIYSGLSVRDVGWLLGMSKSNAHQIEQRAMRRLRVLATREGNE